MVVAILWSLLLGCSPEDSALITDRPCIAPVVEPSNSQPSLVGPPDFSVVGNGSRVTLKWDASSNAFGYQIYIGTISRKYHQVADVGLITEAAVNNLAGGMTYYFVVTAYNSAGESCPSNEVSARIP